MAHLNNFACIFAAVFFASTIAAAPAPWSPPAKLSNNLVYRPDITSAATLAKCLSEAPPTAFCVMSRATESHGTNDTTSSSSSTTDQVCLTCLPTVDDEDERELHGDIQALTQLNEPKWTPSTQVFIRIFNATDFLHNTTIFDIFSEHLQDVVFTFVNGSEAVYEYHASDEQVKTATTSDMANDDYYYDGEASTTLGPNNAAANNDALKGRAGIEKVDTVPISTDTKKSASLTAANGGVSSYSFSGLLLIVTLAFGAVFHY